MDKRKNNGGHSTKSKGPDKRKSEFREAIEEAATIDDVKDVLRMLHRKAIADEDVKAAQLFLGYYLGRPKESKDISIVGEQPIFNIGLEGI